MKEKMLKTTGIPDNDYLAYPIEKGIM